MAFEIVSIGFYILSIKSNIVQKTIKKLIKTPIEKLNATL